MVTGAKKIGVGGKKLAFFVSRDIRWTGTRSVSSGRRPTMVAANLGLEGIGTNGPTVQAAG